MAVTRRTIIHSDMNNFYASVEILYDSSLKGKPVVVVGDAELRHGIVLAKSYEAKAFGIRTGETIWEARQKCRDAVLVPAHFDCYLKYSELARELYISYTDQVEAFGLDECWLDLTGSLHLFGDGQAIADSIRARVKAELGLTVSVGVSYNKVFAKLGSDMRKPDATTVITPEDYREKVWGLPAGDLLYVGPATTAKLLRYGVRTIGDLARADVGFLYHLLGKNGILLHRFANGQDASQVSPYYAVPPMKTVGNSNTFPRDLVTDDDVKIAFLALAESVGARLRAQQCLCGTLQVGIRDNTLMGYERQAKLELPTSNTLDLMEEAFALYKRHHVSGRPVRSLSLRAAGLRPAEELQQLSLFPEEARRQKRGLLDAVIDRVRGKYGYYGIQRGLTLLDPALNLDARGEHIVHPIGALGALSQD